MQVRLGAAAAQDLVNREYLLADDGDVDNALVSQGLEPGEARLLIESCREADSLDDLRRVLGINLAVFNTALAALGPPWVPLRFENELRRTFAARVAERRSELEQRVRNAFLADYDAGRLLTAYIAERTLEWVTIDEAWIEFRDELDNATIDAHIDALFAARYTRSDEASELAAIEATRQHNRAVIVEAAETLRKVILAWAAKDSANRPISATWRGKAEQIAREAMTTGRSTSGALHAAMCPRR